MALGRRALVLGLAGTTLAAAGATLARRSFGAWTPPVLRVGVMSNLTHAPMIAGLGSGRIARALAELGPVRVETRVFRAGPRVTEALLGDAIDAGTSGPAPVVVHHARHARGNKGGLRVLGGVCSGGASLIVTRDSGVTGAANLHGKQLAVTQLGTTQDVALRVYLRDAGLRDTTSGGDVTVLAIAPATILEQMRRGKLHGAWLPEPWATRVVGEVGAIRLIDERDLWPDRSFSTALLAARADNATSPLVQRLALALREEVERALVDPTTTLREAHTELKRHVGNPGKLELFEEAARFVDFTADPLRASVERFGDAAASLGLCREHPTDGLFA